jgi:type IV secretion system protein VirB9
MNFLLLSFFSPEKALAAKNPKNQKSVWTENYGSDVVEEAKQWQRNGTARPVKGKDGLILFPYGQYQPVLTCAPLFACEIALEPGENPKNVVAGDTVRWIVARAESGEGANAVRHVFVKPTEKGITTNLSITTNRRVYVLTLKAKESEYVSRIGFYYPQDMIQNWEDAARREKEQAPAALLPLVSADQLRFDYKIKGDKNLAWFPVRAFSDGTRVYIQMPDSMKSSEAPALVLLNSKGESQLVNYRVNKGYFIVDKVFDHAALIVGVGSDQKKIEIVKEQGIFSGNWKSNLGLGLKGVRALKGDGQNAFGPDISTSHWNNNFGFLASVTGLISKKDDLNWQGNLESRIPLGDVLLLNPHVTASTNPYMGPSIGGGVNFGILIQQNEMFLGYRYEAYDTLPKHTWNYFRAGFLLRDVHYSLQANYEALLGSFNAQTEDLRISGQNKRGSSGSLAFTLENEIYQIYFEAKYACTGENYTCKGKKLTEHEETVDLKVRLSNDWRLHGSLKHSLGSAIIETKSNFQSVTGTLGALYDF